MKKIILILILILVSCNKYDKSELEKVGIYKEIKSYKIIDYKVSNEKEKDTFQTKFFKYNNKGQLISSSIKSHTVKSEYLTEYKYNSKNELIKETGKSSRIEEPIIVEYERINDTLITIHSEIFEKEDSLLFKSLGKEIYNLNKELRKTEMEAFYIDLKNNNDTTFNYKLEDFYKNDLLYKAKVISFDTLLLPNSITEYVRNEKNQIIKVIDSTKGIKTESIYEFEFDEYGSWVKNNVYENGKLVRYFERKIEYK